MSQDSHSSLLIDFMSIYPLIYSYSAIIEIGSRASLMIGVGTLGDLHDSTASQISA